MGISMNGKRRGGVVAGCLIALGVVVVLVVIGGIIVAMNARTWTASLMEKGMNAAVDSATLPEADRAAMKAEIAGLVQGFRDKEITIEQLAEVAEEVTKSPVMPAAGVMFVDEAYIQSSSLPDEEKAEGSKQLSRFIRGLFEETISQTKIDDVTEPIHDKSGSGDAIRIHASNLNIELKNPKSVTPEELRAFLTNCKDAADAAGVPPEAYEVNMAAEFSAAIDRALGRVPAESPTPPPALEEGAGEGAGGDSGGG